MNSRRASRSSSPFQSSFEEARHALLIDAVGRGFLRGLAFGPLLGVLAVIAADRWPIPGLLIGALAALALLVVLVLPWWRVRPWLRDDLALAARLEARRPALRNDVRAVIEFAQTPAMSDEAKDLRHALTTRVVAQLRRSTSWNDILPERQSRNEGIAALVALGATVLLLLTPAFRDAVRPAIVPGELPTTAIDERMLMPPISVTIRPPAYMRLPDQFFRHVSGGLTVPEGSTLFIEGSTFEAVQDVWVQKVGAESRDAFTLLDPHAFEGRIVASEAATYRFGFDVRGREVLDAMPFVLSVHADEAPVIDVLAPSGDLEVTPGEVVEIQYEVRDDYGIRDVQLVWYFQGREQDAERLPLLGEGAGTFAEDIAPFDTAPLYMQPGDEVVVYLEARDNVSFRSPNVGRSEALAFFVQEEHRPEAQLLELKDQLFEGMLRHLGGMLALPMHTLHVDAKGALRVQPRQGLDADNHAALVDGVRATQENWGAIAGLLEQIQELFDTQEQLDEREQRLFATMQSSLQNHDRGIARHLERLSIPLQEAGLDDRLTTPLYRDYANYIADVERATLVLESLISEHQAADVARAIQELSDIRERLRELLEEYRDTRDPELRARIERELDRLAKRMNELIQTISSQVQNLPQEHFNAEALDRSETAEQVDSMGDAMQSMRDLLAQGDIDAAMNAFEQMSQTLDQLERELGDPFMNQDESTLSEFDQAMSEVVDEMNAIEAMQQAIEEETVAMERDLREERLEEKRDELEAILADALKRVREAQERTRQGANPEDDEALEEAQQSAMTTLESLERRLEARDLSTAEDAALDAMEALRSVESDAQRARRFRQHEESESPLDRTAKQSAQDAQRMGELAQELNELQQSLEAQPGPRQQEQLESLAQRQQQAQRRSEGLEQQMQSIGERFPMMSPEGDEGMQQLQEGMGQSSSGLQQRRLGEAQGGQRQAIDSIQQMRQQLQQRMAQSRQQMQRQAQQSGRGRMKEDRVDVTQEGDRDLRHRQQIMEAMREGTLEAWDDPIRQYYESLVR